MSEKALHFWHKIDGPLGAIMMACAFGLFGYVIRGFEDGGIVATLVQQVKSAGVDARADERNICSNRVTNIIATYSNIAKLRDAQVTTLIGQNKALISLVQKSVADQSTALRKANEAVAASSKAADAAENASQKATEVSKKLDTATYPKTAVPTTPWAGKKP